MNDRELDLALADFGAHRVEATAPPVLRQRIRTMPLSPEAGRRWLPQSPKWKIPSMFSALKFVAASVIVALFGGFLLAGVLTPRQDETHPAAVTRSSASPGGAVEVTIEGLESAAGSRLVAILRDEVEGPPDGLGAFTVDITSDPFSVTDTIRKGSEWWDSTTDDEVVDVPPGTYTLRIWVSSNLGPYNEWLPAEPVEAGCLVPLTVGPGGPERVVIVDVPAWDGQDQPCGLEPPEAATSTEQLLSGMVTEEVEPGVWRIVNDGHRDLGSGVSHFLQHAVITDAAGGVWRVTPAGRFFRVGEEPESRFDPGLVEISQSNTEATPDGRLVTVGAIGTRFFSDGSWDGGEYGFEEYFLTDVGVGSDGTIWLVDLVGETLLWYGPDHYSPDWSSWTDVLDGQVPGDEIVVAGDEVWLTAVRDMAAPGTDAFLRFDGTSWRIVPAPDGAAAMGGSGSSFGVTPGGVLWTAADASSPHHSLARYDGVGWTSYGEADGVRPWGGNQGLWPAFEIPVDMLRVAPDGGVWVSAAVVDAAGDAMCDGLGRYDGQMWSPFLSGSCILDYDFAPDGSVWVVAEDGPRPAWTDEASGTVVHTYVITPEAMAGAA